VRKNVCGMLVVYLMIVGYSMVEILVVVSSVVYC